MQEMVWWQQCRSGDSILPNTIFFFSDRFSALRRFSISDILYFLNIFSPEFRKRVGAKSLRLHIEKLSSVQLPRDFNVDSIHFR